MRQPLFEMKTACSLFRNFTLAVLVIATLASSATLGALTVPALLQDDEARQEDDLGQYESRLLAPRPDKTIFSPLDLPTPNRMRTASGLPGEDYWQQSVDYRIDVALDEEKEAIAATAHVTYTNNSPQDLPYLWLSLEQNLFRTDSDGSKFTPPGSRFNNLPGFDGGLKIDYVRAGARDLQLRVYDTVGRLDLAEPVRANGGKTEFDISWSFQIPEYGADRLGMRRVESGVIFQLAQWFPNVCKYDDVHGWNTLPYLGQGEFYTEFGTYDVKITVPREHVVCATGSLKNAGEVLTEKQFNQLVLANTSRQTVMIRSLDEIGKPESVRPGEGPLTWHFHAENVRSFAWTSSAATIWDASAVIWEDGTTTLIQSVYPREARTAWQESTQMLRHSVEHYSKKWFRYPYPTATNVNGTVGGMEYPMIIFCGGDRNKEALFSVTSHEIGHNWFPMVVNSDERRSAWMDEGFNTFINNYDTYANYEAVVNGNGKPSDEVRFSARNMARLMSRPNIQPLALPADQIRPEMLGVLEYYKTSSAMQMLREVVLGPERFDPAFREYIQAWAFKSPQPADFFRCMENGAGTDLAWFWRSWFIENLGLDQAVMDCDQSWNDGFARITLANREEMVMPVFMELTFEDGSKMDYDLPVYVWHYTNLWTAQVPVGEKKVTRVIVDRGRVMPDINRRNNTWNAPKPEKPAEEVKPESESESEGVDAAKSGSEKAVEEDSGREESTAESDATGKKDGDRPRN